MKNDKLHAETKRLARNYVQAEQTLFEALIEIQRREAYRDLGFKGLFTYATKHLGLTEAVAQSFRLVVNSALQFASLRTALAEGEISVAYASRIVSGLTQENVEEILAYARGQSVRETERWMVKEKAIVRFQKLAVTAETRELLKEIKDFMPGNLTDDETLRKVLQQFRDRHHPLEKAKRARRKNPQPRAKKAAHPEMANTATAKENMNHPLRAGRQPLSAQQRHATALRDENQCCYLDKNNERCGQRRWLHRHHIVTVFDGGTNDPDNLISLCPEHHDLVHQMSFPLEQQRSWQANPTNASAENLQ